MEFHANDVTNLWQQQIRNAKKSIRIYAPFWDTHLLKLLDKRDKKVIPSTMVEIITSRDDHKYLVSERACEALEKAFFNQKYRIYGLDDLHAKLLFIDGKLVTSGSQNFTCNSATLHEATTTFTASDCQEEQQAITQINEWYKEALKQELDGSEIKNTLMWARNRRDAYERISKERQFERRLEQTEWHSIQIDNRGYVTLNSEKSINDLIKEADPSIEKSDWLPLLNNLDKKLYFVRTNQESLSLYFKDIELEVPAPSSGNTYNVNVKPVEKKDYNLLVTISRDNYQAELKLEFDGNNYNFKKWRTNFIKWASSKNKQMDIDISELLQLDKSDKSVLINELLVKFKPSNIQNKYDRIGSIINNCNTLCILQCDDHPVIVVDKDR